MPDPIIAETALAEKLKEALAPAIDRRELLTVTSQINAGEPFYAIDDLLNFAARTQTGVPGNLVEAIREQFPVRETREDIRFHGFLDRVLVA